MITNLTKQIDKIFHDRIRLGAMSVIVMSAKGVTFQELVQELEVTRGNLSVHMKVLEQNNFVSVTKEFVNNKPRTTFKVTPEGTKAFEEYLSLLEEIVKGIKK